MERFMKKTMLTLLAALPGVVASFMPSDADAITVKRVDWSQSSKQEGIRVFSGSKEYVVDVDSRKTRIWKGSNAYDVDFNTGKEEKVEIKRPEITVQKVNY